MIDLDTDEILGTALPRAGAPESIDVATQAMRHGIKAGQFEEAIYTQPSSTEAFNDVMAAVVRSDA